MLMVCWPLACVHEGLVPGRMLPIRLPPTFYTQCFRFARLSSREARRPRLREYKPWCISS